jgi:hypothetical protein
MEHRSRSVLFICALAVAVIAAIDLLTANLNLSILYTLPVLLAARLEQRRVPKRFMVTAIVLTYAGYFLGPWPRSLRSIQDLIFNYRMLNRTLSVIVICAITAISNYRLRILATMKTRSDDLDALDPDGRIYDDILSSFERLTATVIAVVLIAGVAIADFVTPAQFNLPILYGVPLVICAWTGRRAMIWGVLPVLLFFTFAGILIGPSSTVPGTLTISSISATTLGSAEAGVMIGNTESRFPSILTNRTLAACVILGGALVLHWWIGAAQRSRGVSSPI